MWECRHKLQKICRIFIHKVLDFYYNCVTMTHLTSYVVICCQLGIFIQKILYFYYISTAMALITLIAKNYSFKFRTYVGNVITHTHVGHSFDIIWSFMNESFYKRKFVLWPLLSVRDVILLKDICIININRHYFLEIRLKYSERKKNLRELL